jgi:hypothetical protein
MRIPTGIPYKISPLFGDTTTTTQYLRDVSDMTEEKIG